MSKVVRNKFITLICSFLLPMTSFATEIDSKGDKVSSDVKKGTVVPYSGILLSYKLAAEVMENCKPEVIDARCKVKIDEAVALSENKCKSEKSVCQVSVDACQKKYNDVSVAHRVQVDKLEARIAELTPRWYENPKLWFGVGIFAGAAATVTVIKSIN